MGVIALTRAYAVVLPGIMETFEMSPSQGGRFIATIEGASVVSLLVLGLTIERIGAVRVLLIGLSTVAVTLLAMASIPNMWLLTPILVLLGSGMAWTTTSINTLMAATGRWRSFYLGLMHSTFGAYSVAAPLLAAWVLAWYSWQTWYAGVSVLVIGCAVLVWKIEVLAKDVGDGANRRSREVPIAPGAGPSVRILGTVCLGIFALTGVQGVLNTWSFLYIANVYDVKDEFAMFGPACFWGGILVGRVGMIWLARLYSARRLLILSALVPSVAMGAERFFPSPWVALSAMLLVGVGVSGTYQLGTQWAVERLPNRVGTASTAVMASGWLGIGIWSWIAGVLIEMTSFSCLAAIVLFGSLVAVLSFGATTPPGSSRP